MAEKLNKFNNNRMNKADFIESVAATSSLSEEEVKKNLDEMMQKVKEQIRQIEMHKQRSNPSRH
jgi:polyhydroxyalkanoate synthesis regulator phasin